VPRSAWMASWSQVMPWDRLEVHLKDRLQHQHQAGLHEPVHRGRDAQPPPLAVLAGLGDHAFPHRQRSEPASLELLPRVCQEGFGGGLAGDERGNDPVHPGRACPPVAPHPFPRNSEEVRVADEVEQIVEPTARIGGRPLVQLGLHPLYSLPGLIEVRPRLTGIHQRLQPLQCLACVNPLGPFAMYAAFPRSDYYGPSAPPRRRRQTTCLSATATWPATAFGDVRVVPTFTSNRSAGEVPSYAPAASPRLRRSPSPWPPGRRHIPGPGVPRSVMRERVRAAIQSTSTGLELADSS
jgi:hypothetical protein